MIEMGEPGVEYFDALSMNCSSAVGQYLAVAVDLEVSRAVGHFYPPAVKLLAISRQDVFNQREHGDALPPEPDFRGIDPRHLEELGSQAIQMVRLLVDESGQFGVIGGEASAFEKPRACRPYRRERRLERVGERVENRRAKLLSLARRLGPALLFEGTRALQSNGRQRCNRDDA